MKTLLFSEVSEKIESSTKKLVSPILVDCAMHWPSITRISLFDNFLISSCPITIFCLTLNMYLSKYTSTPKLPLWSQQRKVFTDAILFNRLVCTRTRREGSKSLFGRLGGGGGQKVYLVDLGGGYNSILFSLWGGGSDASGSCRKFLGRRLGKFWRFNTGNIKFLSHK